MGRKQKLRQECKIRNKAAAAVVVTTTLETTVEATSEGIISGSESRSNADTAGQTADSSIASSKGLKQQEYRAIVEDLVQRVVPEEIQNVDEMMLQFRGREDELVETLRTMQERAVAQKARHSSQRAAKQQAKLKSATAKIESETNVPAIKSKSIGTGKLSAVPTAKSLGTPATKQNKTTLQQGRKMSESHASQGRAKRIKLVGSDSVGSPPKEISDDNVIAKIEYPIDNFANREEKRGECFHTGAMHAHGHPWKLKIYPRGHSELRTDAEYVTLGLYYAGENTKTDPVVVAKAMIHTKTKRELLDKEEYYNEDGSCNLYNFSKREDIIKNDCDDAGALTITIELKVATNKNPTVAPHLLPAGNNSTTKKKLSNKNVNSLLPERQTISLITRPSTHKTHLAVLSEHDPSSSISTNQVERQPFIREETVPDIELPAGRTWKEQLKYDLKDEDDMALISSIDSIRQHQKQL